MQDHRAGRTILASVFVKRAKRISRWFSGNRRPEGPLCESLQANGIFWGDGFRYYADVLALFYGLNSLEYTKTLKCILDDRQKIYNKDVSSELIELSIHFIVYGENAFCTE